VPQEAITSTAIPLTKPLVRPLTKPTPPMLFYPISSEYITVSMCTFLVSAACYNNLDYPLKENALNQ
jgi:hypothetical protein